MDFMERVNSLAALVQGNGGVVFFALGPFALTGVFRIWGLISRWRAVKPTLTIEVDHPLRISNSSHGAFLAPTLCVGRLRYQGSESVRITHAQLLIEARRAEDNAGLQVGVNQLNYVRVRWDEQTGVIPYLVGQEHWAYSWADTTQITTFNGQQARSATLRMELNAQRDVVLRPNDTLPLPMVWLEVDPKNWSKAEEEFRHADQPLVLRIVAHIDSAIGPLDARASIEAFLLEIPAATPQIEVTGTPFPRRD